MTGCGPLMCPLNSGPHQAGQNHCTPKCRAGGQSHSHSKCKQKQAKASKSKQKQAKASKGKQRQVLSPAFPSFVSAPMCWSPAETRTILRPWRRNVASLATCGLQAHLSFGLIAIAPGLCKEPREVGSLEAPPTPDFPTLGDANGVVASAICFTSMLPAPPAAI